MFKTFLIVVCSMFMVVSTVEVKASPKSESGGVKARYSFKKGQKNKKNMEKISQRGGLTF